MRSLGSSRGGARLAVSAWQRSSHDVGPCRAGPFVPAAAALARAISDGHTARLGGSGKPAGPGRKGEVLMRRDEPG